MPSFNSRMLLLAVLLLMAGAARAQTVVTGRVTDAETGVPLPAATVQVEGTYQGTITNADGVYALRVGALPATLLVRFIGYQTARRPVDASSPSGQDIALVPVAYELDELVVTDEDPAVGIMRRVIERKQQWRAALETYRAEAYNRFTLRNDTGIVSIIESLSEAYWDKGQGTREIVKSKRQTSNLRLEEYLPAALFVANLYDDDIEVAGYRLIGVTHPEALRHYEFRLEGTRQLDDRRVFDIAVRPRTRLKSAFEGRVAVLDEAYALLEVALRPSEAFRFPPPVEQFDVTYLQQFSDFGQGVWLPVDFRADVDLRINLSGLLVFPRFRLHQVSRLTGYEVNVPLPDSLYAGDRRMAVDSTAVRTEALLEQAGAVVPLTAVEATAYEQIDSTMTLERAFQPEGPLGRMMRVRREAERRDDGRSGPSLGERLGLALHPELWFDRVDALHAGLWVESTPTERLTLQGGGGYSTGLEGSDRWSYGGEATVRWGLDLQGEVSVRYEARTAMRYDSDLYPLLFNSVYVLFGGGDYFDYYREEGFRARAQYEFFPLPFSVRLTYRDARHTSLPKTTDYDLLGQAEPLRPNPPVEAGRLRSVEVGLVYAEEAVPLSFFGRRRAALYVEHSLPDLLGSDFSFTRYGLTVDWRFETFFRRRAIPNALDLRLSASTFSGELLLQRFGIVEGRMGPYTPFGALKTLSGQPYEGEQHLALYWEHNFRTVPFEVLGLDFLVTRGINLVLHGAHGRTWVSDARLDALMAAQMYRPRLSDGFHHEVGLSLSGLFGLLRLDVTTRLDAPGFSVGLASARVF